MKVVIHQPSYIPWRGYFDQIRRADLFIFYDDVQYDKRGWRNRNQIKTHRGKRWLTIPVHARGAQSGIPIKDIRIDWSQPWNEKHLRALNFSYGRSPCFDSQASWLDSLYRRRDERLADFTIAATMDIVRKIGIHDTRFMRSSEIPGVTGRKTERLVRILRSVGARHYITGPSARDYIVAEPFAEAGISVEFLEYDYPVYPQLFPPFDPFVSILDLIFMVGEENVLDYL